MCATLNSVSTYVASGGGGGNGNDVTFTSSGDVMLTSAELLVTSDGGATVTGHGSGRVGSGKGFYVVRVCCPASAEHPYSNAAVDTEVRELQSSPVQFVTSKQTFAGSHGPNEYVVRVYRVLPANLHAYCQHRPRQSNNNNTRTHARTHTHTRLTAFLPGLPG